ncbi:MAG: hypothetical protein V4538_15435 [Bacteroidota bacterium]
MLQLKKDILYYNDENYNHAVNYQHMYNAPITLNFGKKHNRSKYIISAGTCDHITLLQDGIFIYVIAENTGLSYISLQVINTELKQVEGDVFLNEQDCTNEENFSFGILDMAPNQQLKILSEYL